MKSPRTTATVFGTGHTLTRRAMLGGMAAAGATMSFALAGCSGDSGLPGGNNGAVPTQFNFSTWGDYRFYQDGFSRMQNAVPKYKPTKFNNQQATDPTTLAAKLQSGFVAKAYSTLPDVFEVNWSDIPHLSQAGILTDLTAKLAPYKDQVSKAAIDSVSYQGKIMACPWRPNTILMWYREDIWNEAGIDAANIKVWSDFVAAGQKLQSHSFADGKKRYIVGLEPSAAFNAFLYTQQGGVLFDAKSGQLTNFSSDPHFRNAFDLQVQWAKTGIGLQIASYTPSWFTALDDGILSCVVTGSWMDQMLQQNVTKSAGKWKVAALPGFAPGDTGQALEGAAAVCATKMPNTDQDLNWAFMQTCFFDQQVTPSLYDRWHLNPVFAPAAKQTQYHQPQAYYGGQNVGALDDDVQKTAFTPVGSPDYALLMNTLGSELGAASSGKKSVDDAIASAYAAARSKGVGA